VPGFTFLGKQDLYSKVDINDSNMSKNQLSYFGNSEDLGDNRDFAL